jgi:hypothetical protein
VIAKMRLWRQLATKNGLEGIYFVGHTYHLEACRSDLESMGFDALNTVRMYDYERKQKCLKKWANVLHKIFRFPHIVAYSKANRYFVTDAEREENIFPTIIPNWDHTPRTGNAGLVLHGSTPENFGNHLDDVLDHINHKSAEHRIAFIKSWNEWAEGNYLEPDLKFGTKYLEVIRRRLIP